MKYRYFIYPVFLIAILLYITIPVSGQISPGKLSNPHSHLEGISQCTQCHNLGDKISEEKCLNCHSHLKQRIQSGKGYHVSSEIKSKSCIQCHSEHHGIKFEMVRFDKKTFNHDLTGYKLQGAHRAVDCRSCHAPENISNSEIRKNPTTYLGLDTRCVNCHEDFHQKTLSADCSKCHDFEHWSPASLFKHSRTKFPLNGAHQKVDCKICHPAELRSGQSFQKFAGLDFKTCASCHQDPHRGVYGKQCQSCHNESDFHKITPNSGFNHSITGYVLEGKHKQIDCKKCHDNRNNPQKLFQEFNMISPIVCKSCHEDPHENKFGPDCAGCHQQNSFRISGVMERFDHQLTAFPLIGKHKNLQCKLCHRSGKMTDPINHESCTHCHEDYHQNLFFISGKYKDCKDCHHENGFVPSLFGFEDHQKSRFPLNGAHQATACIACHKLESQWQYQWKSLECQSCHQDPHEQKINSKFYQPNHCASCHSEASWSEIQFDHQQTKFGLEGKHQKISCRKCHFEIFKEQRFANLEMRCQECHEEPHHHQFENPENKQTDCQRCHKAESWTTLIFNHDSSRFSLTGTHKSLSCARCHTPVSRDGKSYILYRNDKLECRDCHL